MKKLDIKFLIESPNDNIIENLEIYFKDLLQELKIYLGLDLVNRHFKILFDHRDLESKGNFENIADIGVNRTFQNELIIIRIFSNFAKFIPIILLREAYFCFIPDDLKQNEIINIFINQKIEIDLQNLPSIQNWKIFIRENIINYEFMFAEFDRLDKFLKREEIESIESPFQFFFQYLRRNIQLIRNNMAEFYDNLYSDYILKVSKSLFNDQIVETLKILIKLFFEVKSYKALLDYQKYFKKFTENGIIKTDLSLNKFTENMKWIKNFSDIAPSYQINWKALNIISIICILSFNPIIKKRNINTILKEVPFFIFKKFSKNDFGFEVVGYFLIPKEFYSDLINFIKKLEDYGYIFKKYYYTFNKHKHLVNLNYFREFYDKKSLINFTKHDYERQYEIEFTMEYGEGNYDKKLSLLDWLILDRIRYFSITGFGFERRNETLIALKSDLLNEVRSQRVLIEDLKKNYENINLSIELKDKFLNFIESNQDFGFFFIKNMLNSLLITFDITNTILNKNHEIQNYLQFQDFVNKNAISNSIEESILFKKNKAIRVFLKELIPLYFKSNKQYYIKAEEFRSFYKMLQSFYNLKIFNLNNIKKIIHDKTIFQKIYQSKEEKLIFYYENLNLHEITNQFVETKLETYLNNNPPLIKPILISTIITPPQAHYYTILIVKNSPKIQNHINTLKKLFPRVLILESREIESQDKYVYLEFYIPNLNQDEKKLFYSIINNKLKDDIILFKQFLTRGFTEAFSRKDFYDLERQEFFYSKDLFEQFFVYVQKILGNKLKPLQVNQNKIEKSFWSNEKNIQYLIKQVENRIRSENIDLNTNNLHRVLEFSAELEENIFDIDRFKKSQGEYFFKNYIKSINFLPLFKNFGFSQYFLYFYPTDINQIDFKLLLSNSFQSIKYPAQIDSSNSFLFQYIFPYRNLGISPYLNWLTKSKKIVREYCLFFVKKVYQILHFNYNLSSDGWDLDPNRFKIYFQNILFNPDYKVQIPDMKEFNIGDLNVSDYFGPDSPEFQALSQIYNRQSLDIKSYLTRRYFTLINHITELLKKGLIFPYISVKNLDLIEEITIILPNVKQELNETIIKIFSFFNVGFIYEVEGEYFIHGFSEVIKFENGMMIKLRLPDCQLDEFEKLFDLIFEYLEIDHYLVLNDLVDGENLIKSTLHELEILETYNPLINLIWNDKDKKWRNHKLFNEKFEPFYPDLLYGKDKYNL